MPHGFIGDHHGEVTSQQAHQKKVTREVGQDREDRLRGHLRRFISDRGKIRAAARPVFPRRSSLDAHIMKNARVKLCPTPRPAADKGRTRRMATTKLITTARSEAQRAGEVVGVKSTARHILPVPIGFAARTAGAQKQIPTRSPLPAAVTVAVERRPRRATRCRPVYLVITRRSATPATSSALLCCDRGAVKEQLGQTIDHRRVIILTRHRLPATSPR